MSLKWTRGRRGKRTGRRRRIAAKELEELSGEAELSGQGVEGHAREGELAGDDGEGELGGLGVEGGHAGGHHWKEYSGKRRR